MNLYIQSLCSRWHVLRNLYSVFMELLPMKLREKRYLKLSWLISYLNIMLKCRQSRWLIKCLMTTMVTPLSFYMLFINFLYVYIKIPHNCSNFLEGRFSGLLLLISFRITATLLTFDLLIISKTIFAGRTLRIFDYKRWNRNWVFLEICFLIIMILPASDF